MTNRTLTLISVKAIVILASTCISTPLNAGHVSGIATDLKVEIALGGVLVEAFAVDAVGNVAATSFASDRTLQDGTFDLDLGDQDRRILLKFSRAGRTNVFIPNVNPSGASGAIVVLAGGLLDGIAVIVPEERQPKTACAKVCKKKHLRRCRVGRR